MNTVSSAVFPQSTSILNAGKLCMSDEEKFVNEENNPKMYVRSVNPITELILLLLTYTLITYVYFIAFKFASEDGLTFSKFLLAYFFTIPYIIIKLVMKSSKK